MKFILQKNLNPLVDYDATYYYYKCGYRITIAYIHGLESENPDIEWADNIISMDILKLIIQTIENINKDLL